MTEILTAILVVITAFYAWVTFRILRANECAVEAVRQQTEAVYRPYVSVGIHLEPDNPIFYLRIANTGKTSAMNLRLAIDRSFFKFGESAEDHDLAKLSAFNKSFDSFPPGSEMTFSLAQGFVVFAKDADPAVCPKKFTITAAYEFGGREVEESHNIDLTPYLGADVPQEAVIRKLKAIDDSIGKLIGAVQKRP